MQILSLVTLLLRGAHALIAWLDKRQLLEAGAARSLSAGLAALVAQTEDIRRAQADLRRDPAARQRVRDKFTRPDGE